MFHANYWHDHCEYRRCFSVRTKPHSLIFVVLSIGLAIGKIRFIVPPTAIQSVFTVTSHLSWDILVFRLTLMRSRLASCFSSTVWVLKRDQTSLVSSLETVKHYHSEPCGALYRNCFNVFQQPLPRAGLWLGLSAGMMAGALAPATPILVGAQMLEFWACRVPRNMDIGLIIENLSVGYAMAYLVSLINAVMFTRLIPKALES